MIESLSDQDLQYICSVFPLKNAVGYFQKNSKEFGKLHRGFRAQSFDDTQKEHILYRGVKSKNRFVCDFISKSIRGWLTQISECIEQEIDKTKDKKKAILNTLVDSYFAKNVALYFRLAEIDESEEDIASAQNIVDSLKQEQINAQAIEKRFAEKDAEIEKLLKQLERVNKERSLLDSRNTSLGGYLADEKKNTSFALLEKGKIEKELAELKLNSSRQIEKLSLDLHKTENDKRNLKTDMEKLKLEISEKSAKIIQLNIEIEKASLYMKVAGTGYDVTRGIPLRPINMDDFKECLGYAFEAFGVKEGKNLLVNYLSYVLFTGRPIAVERLIVHNFANCLSNTLCSGSEVKTLIYSTDVDTDIISKFLSNDCRIVILDNFIGNMNETLLLPLLDKHKEKIILLGVAYEKTLKYVSDEFWIYAKHLNLLHTGGFFSTPAGKEDTLKIDEHPFDFTPIIVDTRLSKIFVEIAEELKIPKKYARHRAHELKNEEMLFGLLVFELMPFVYYSLGKNPLASERLQKYIKTSKSTYVELMKEWYGA
jgi:hypothetical protein